MSDPLNLASRFQCALMTCEVSKGAMCASSALLLKLKLTK